MILRMNDIFILPAVDMPGFDTAKVGGINFQKSRMTRKDVIMDSKALSLSYHAMEQVMTSLQSLVTQYPSYAKMYDHPDLECIKITNDITSSSTKLVIRVVGWRSA